MSQRPRLVDWSTLVLLLHARSGMGYDRLGRQCNTDCQHIGRLMRGEVAEPRFSTGIQLLDLAADHLNADDWARVRRQSPLARAA